MADTTGRISGGMSLSEIESAMQDQEAKSYELLTWKIENDKDNLADFKRLPLGTFSKDLRLTLAAAPKPPGFGAIAGTPLPMMVGAQKKDVTAWRKQ